LRAPRGGDVSEVSDLREIAGWGWTCPFSTTLGRFRSKAGESEVQVPRTRPAYPEEFRREAIKPALLGDKPQRKLAKDLGISDVTLRNWPKQERAERSERPDGLSGDEREELARLRDENAKLRMEREILSKAAVFFAKESDGR
jgi:transposase